MEPHDNDGSKYVGKIELTYHFTDPLYYKQIENFNNAILMGLPSNGFQAVSFLFKYLMNPTAKTIDFLKNMSTGLTQMAQLIVAIEKMRIEGHCQLIDRQSQMEQHKNKKTPFSSVVLIDITIDLCSKIPTDMLSHAIKLTDIKDNTVRMLAADYSNLLIKGSLLIDKFIKQNITFLEKLRKDSVVNEIMPDFLIQLVQLFKEYLECMPLILKLITKITKKIGKKDKSVLEAMELDGHVNISYNINTNEKR